MNAFPAILAGTSIVLVLTDGSELTGTYKGTNSKGVRIVLDGTTKETTRALSKIDSVREAEGFETLTDDSTLVAEVTVADETLTFPEDKLSETAMADYLDSEDDETPAHEVSLDNANLEAIQAAIAAGDSEGFSSGELAAIFGDSAYNLRKVFRSLGMGVGKGSRYHLDGNDVKKVYDYLND